MKRLAVLTQAASIYQKMSNLNKIMELRTLLEKEGVPFKADVSLKEFSWFKSGGKSSLVIFPESVDALVDALSSIRSKEIGYKVIGETSNLMFLDDKEYSCLVCTKNIKHMKHSKNDGIIEVETGAMLPDLSRFALYEEVGGYAGFEGIPGTIGGAVFMNAGAYNYSIDQVLIDVDVLMPDGSVETHPASKLGLKHRDSAIKRGEHPGIILRSRFRAEAGDPKKIYGEMELYHAKRHKYLEYMYPNLGSVWAGSVFRELGKKDRVYAVLSGVYFLLNYRYKLFRRESPINRKWLNDLTVKRFGLKFRKQPYSEKTINMLINNGHHTDELLDYIRQIQDIIGDSIPLENEIVQPF